MKAISFGLLFWILALPLACGDDDDAAGDGEAGTGAEPTNGGGAAGTGTGGAGGGGAPGGASGADERQAICETICTTEADLACAMPRDACLDLWCGNVDVIWAPCVEQYDVVLSCIVDEPSDSYDCVDGMPLLKEEVCSDEEEVLLICLSTQ